jgi:ribose 5-phosphate isomerase A
MDIEAQKRAAAIRAIEFVRPGMRLGLGTGSTARHFVELVGERVRAGLDIVAVPTSQTTHADAERFGIPLTTLDEVSELDLTVDGADEIGPDLSLIKGGGGALLREKIVAGASARMIVIADESKFAWPFPVADRGGTVRRGGHPARAGKGSGGPSAARDPDFAKRAGWPCFRHGRRSLDRRRRAGAD